MTDEQPIKLKIEFDVPDDFEAKYANNMVVQHTGHEFIISFFETRPPVFLGGPEENREALNQLGGKIRARCVAQVIVAASKMPEFVNALTENLTTYTLNYPKEGVE